MKLEEMDQAQLIAYVKELRQENQDRRESVEMYEEAFKEFDEAQQRGLMHMIRTLGESPEQGSILFRELADSIDGDTQPKEVEMADEETTNDESLEDKIAAAVTAALDARASQEAEQRTAAEQAEFEKQVAYWDNEAKKLGFEPNTPEAADLFFMANKLNTTDLKEAADYLEKFNKFVGDNSEESEPKAEESSEDEEEIEFPKSAGKGQGAPAAEADEFDYSDSGAVRDAVMAMIQADAEGV